VYVYAWDLMRRGLASQLPRSELKLKELVVALNGLRCLSSTCLVRGRAFHAAKIVQCIT
jgi:hypothetical protein